MLRVCWDWSTLTRQKDNMLYLFHKGHQPLCCQPGSSYKLWSCITSNSKFRNQIQSPNNITIYLKPSHILSKGTAKNCIFHRLLNTTRTNGQNHWCLCAPHFSHQTKHFVLRTDLQAVSEGWYTEQMYLSMLYSPFVFKLGNYKESVVHLGPLKSRCFPAFDNCR